MGGKRTNTGQLRLLLWKNWIVTKRAPCCTCCTILVPTAFVLLLVSQGSPRAPPSSVATGAAGDHARSNAAPNLVAPPNIVNTSLSKFK